VWCGAGGVWGGGGGGGWGGCGAGRRARPPQFAARGLGQQARNRQEAAGVLWTEPVPFTLLDRSCRGGIEALGGRIIVVVGQIGADHDERFVFPPKPPQYLAHFLRLCIPDYQRDEEKIPHERLQERQLDFERMFGSVRGVMRAHEWKIGECS